METFEKKMNSLWIAVAQPEMRQGNEKEYYSLRWRTTQRFTRLHETKPHCDENSINSFGGSNLRSRSPECGGALRGKSSENYECDLIWLNRSEIEQIAWNDNFIAMLCILQLLLLLLYFKYFYVGRLSSVMYYIIELVRVFVDSCECKCVCSLRGKHICNIFR